MVELVNLVFVIILIVNTLLSFKSPRYGLSLYLILSFVLPHLRLLGPAVPYEIAAFPPVLFACLYVNKFRFSVNPDHIIFLVYIVISLLSTYFASLQYSANVLWIPVLGLVRVTITLVLIRQFLDSWTISKILSVVIAVNATAALLQVFVDGSISITYSLYSKEIGGGVLDQYMMSGVIPRATGTLVSPVNLGVISLLSFSVAFQRILSGTRTIYDKVSILASIIAGLAALSKTSIIGIPLLLIVGGAMSSLSIVKRRGRINITSLPKVAVALSVGGAVVWWLVSYLRDLGFAIMRYLGFLLNPLESFETRYGSGSTTLDKTIEVTVDNWLTGVGFTAPFDEFLGDSTYVLAAHNIGVTSVIIISGLYLYSSYRGIQVKQIFGLLPLMALALTGLALPTLFNIKGALVLGYINCHEKDSIQ